MAERDGVDLAGLDLEIPDYSDDNGCNPQYRYWGSRLLVLMKVVEQSEKIRLIRWVSDRYHSYREHIVVVLAALALAVAIVSGIVQPWLQSREQAGQVAAVILLNATSVSGN